MMDMMVLGIHNVMNNLDTITKHIVLGNCLMQSIIGEIKIILSENETVSRALFVIYNANLIRNRQAVVKFYFIERNCKFIICK